MDKQYFYYNDYNKRKFMLEDSEDRQLNKSEKIHQIKWVMIKIWIIIGLIFGLEALTYFLTKEWKI